MLMLVPVSNAVQNILLRKMRKMNADTVAIYVNVSSTFAGVFIMYFWSYDFGFISRIFTASPLVAALFCYTGTTNVLQ